jgi:hypothetical protein
MNEETWSDELDSVYAARDELRPYAAAVRRVLDLCDKIDLLYSGVPQWNRRVLTRDVRDAISGQGQGRISAYLVQVDGKDYYFDPSAKITVVMRNETPDA